jgi:hypothetical protein
MLVGTSRGERGGLALVSRQQCGSLSRSCSGKPGYQEPGVSGPVGSNAQGTAPRSCRSCNEKLWVRMRLVTSWVRSVSPKMSSW